MKKVASLLLSLVFLFILCACGNSEENEPQYTRQDKSAVLELSGGWVMYYERQEVYDANGSFNQAYCSLDGVNLKYQDLSDFNMRLIDKKTGEVTGSIPPAVHFFQMNKIYEDKITPINAALEMRPPTPDLTLDELQGQDISGLMFTLEDVVNVYNAAMANGVKEPGKYMNLSSANIVSEAMLDGYQWQVGYFILSGQIAALDIELIYDDGSYLSDMDEATLSGSQKELKQVIGTITGNILRSGSLLDLGIDHSREVGQVQLSRLYKLLNSIEVENENSPS